MSEAQNRDTAERRRTRRPGLLAALCIAALALCCGPAAAVVVVPDGGITVHGSPADVRRGIDIAHDAGARWISLGWTWEQLEPAPGNLDGPAWDDLGGELAYAKSRGMNVELRFTNAPPWASGKDGRDDDPPTPEHAQDYGDFLAALATRFGDMIDAYSPWNEPNISNFWNPVSPEAYTAVQKVAYASIKAKDPTATVLSATIVGTYPNAYGYLKRAYAAGLKGSADVIGWNSYPHGEPESSYSDENGLPSGSSLPGQLYLRDLINQYDPGRKVWIMELSWSTCVPCIGFPANGATEAQQADYLSRTFAYRRRYLTDITERIFWFELRDGGTEPHNWEHHQGLVRRDFSGKPALAAFTAAGIDVPEGAPLPGTSAVDTPVGVGGTALPPAAVRQTPPATAASKKGRIALGKPTFTGRRGRFTLSISVAVSGGAARLRIQGYRGTRWRDIRTLSVPRSGRLTIGFPDKAYLGIRVLATIPGIGLRAGRVVRVKVGGSPARTAP